MKRVMVTGSRDFTDRTKAREALVGLVEMYVPVGEDVELIHGDDGNEEATEGADRICASIAEELGWKAIPFRADWAKYGKAAGPYRNGDMAQSKPKPAVCIAFPLPGSRGTWNAVAQARGAGIPVEIVR